MNRASLFETDLLAGEVMIAFNGDAPLVHIHRDDGLVRHSVDEKIAPVGARGGLMTGTGASCAIPLGTRQSSP